MELTEQPESTPAIAPPTGGYAAAAARHVAQGTSYQPTASERTAGQAIAHAMSLFIADEIGQSGLAKAIDDALRSYR